MKLLAGLGPLDTEKNLEDQGDIYRSQKLGLAPLTRFPGIRWQQGLSAWKDNPP
jgi:hypothetical protein